MSAERRKQLELLQARLKEAKADFEAAHTEGYAEELKQLFEQARAVDAEAVLREREARDTTRQLESFRHDVEEAERQLLAPKVVSSTGAATSLLAVGAGVAGVVTVATLLSGTPTLGGYLLLGVLAVAPPPLLAWIWRRRLSGGGTFRNPS